MEDCLYKRLVPHTIRRFMKKLTLILAFMALASSANFVLASEVPVPASPPVASLGIINGVATISVNSSSGYLYQLETSESLDSGWVPLNEELAGNEAILQFTDTTPVSAIRFYRIQRRKAVEGPDGFAFTSLTNAAPDSLITSNSI